VSQSAVPLARRRIRRATASTAPLVTTQVSLSPSLPNLGQLQQADVPGIQSDPGAVYSFSGPANSQTLNITQGTVRFVSDLSTSYPNLAVAVSPSATLLVQASQNLRYLGLGGGNAVVDY